MENDFIKTPKEIIDVLLQYEQFDGDILEPCCGDGSISDVLKQKYNVISSDKIDYGYGNIKSLFNIKEQYDNVITNPPFSKQQLIKKHLFSVTKNKLALLWYVKNIGNEIETKTGRHLKSIYVFKNKIEWINAKINYLFAWYVWDKNYIGDIVIKRIDYKKTTTQNIINFENIDKKM